MKIERIAKILDAHYVPYYVRNGRIFADTMEATTPIFEEAEDVTEYTRDELYAWLGY